MKTLSRRDIGFSVATGLTTGIFLWRIFVYLQVMPLGFDSALLVLVVPLLWLAGVQFGYALAGLFSPMAQFGRFTAIGFTNAAVDFAVLYLLIALTGKASGSGYTLFKSISFLVAVGHSFFWNKYWAFDAGRRATSGREIFSFTLVSLASLAVNVAMASATVALGPLGGLGAEAWAGVGAIAGSAAALLFSFIGLRVFVFRKN